MFIFGYFFKFLFYYRRTKNKYFYFYILTIKVFIYMSITFDIIRIMLTDKFSFHNEQIQLETKLYLELGMDSREMLEFLEELENIFKISINLDVIDFMVEENEMLTIKDMVHYIDKEQSEKFEI